MRYALIVLLLASLAFATAGAIHGQNGTYSTDVTPPTFTIAGDVLTFAGDLYVWNPLSFSYERTTPPEAWITLYAEDELSTEGTIWVAEVGQQSQYGSWHR